MTAAPPAISLSEPRIRLLSDEVASQIAAGEVVERPASVVKELAENALDAGATRLLVELEDGGRRLIRVSDNGGGMTAQEAVLAFQRHATSKIASAADLLAVRTLGFRGEALPSIASVSRVTLVTRPPETVEATRLEAAAGEILALEPAGSPVGTSVTVTDLFYNLPARLKFLKSPRAELAQAHDALARLACARSEVAFLLRHDGAELMRTPGGGDLLNALTAIHGAEFARALIPVSWGRAEVRLTGFVAPPTVTRPTRAQQVFFVNGRVVRSRTLMHALDEAYRGTVPVGRYSPAVLRIEIDPALVDVNVHPSKAEVRFLRDWEAHRAVREAVGTALGRPAGAMTVVRETLLRPEELGRPGLVAAVPAAARPPGAAAGAALPLESPAARSWRPIAQLWEAFILADCPTGLLIIDQHLAHERVLYQKLLSGLGTTRRELAAPLAVPVTPRDEIGLAALRPALERLGFDLEPFGPGVWLLRSVPLGLPAGQEASLLRDVLESGSVDGAPGPLPVERLAATAACRAAIKKGTALTLPEMERLLADLDLAGPVHTCPHGCPIAVELPYAELLRRFKRV